MGLYKTFKTDENLETQGSVLDYGDFQVRIAYAGGANKRYTRYAEEKLKPLNRAIQTGALNEERSRKIMADIYAETIILDWQTIVDEKPVKGIEGPDGEIIEFNVENVKMTLENLPALFNDIQDQANSIAVFRQKDLEDEAKNS